MTNQFDRYWAGEGVEPTVVDRRRRFDFWRRVEFSDQCWEWQGQIGPFGYGIAHINDGNVMAHRAAWESFYGPIPAGLVVCHHCDNPPCCNPRHLFLGTRVINNLDCGEKDRRATRANGAGKLSAEDIATIRTLYATGTYTHKELGALYGVTGQTIGAHCRDIGGYRRKRARA